MTTKTATKTIYIAEDFGPQLELMKSTIGNIREYEVKFFSDGLHVYREVQKKKPDLLILDIIMPSLSGLAVTRLLKFHENYRDIPIIVASSIIDDDIMERANAAGADVFLQKPFHMNELMDYVKGFLTVG